MCFFSLVVPDPVHLCFDKMWSTIQNLMICLLKTGVLTSISCCRMTLDGMSRPIAFKEFTMKTDLLPIGSLLLISASVVACTQDSKNTVLSPRSATTANLPVMTVYKSPTCGCCQDWITYIESAGYSVNDIDHDNIDAIKAEYGLTAPSLKSCHTAVIDGYVIEGHVPVTDIERLLSERPDVVGLTAPGMPMMSPGMGSELPKDYDVLAFDKDGHSQVYSSY